MFFAIQFPLADVRPFLTRETGRLLSPSWPLAQPGKDFVRAFGAVRKRLRGGLAEWAGEDVYCSAKRALRFESALRTLRLGSVGSSMVPLSAFRRFHSDGEAVSRVELGFKHDSRVRELQSLSGSEILALIAGLLSLQARVPSKEERLISCALIDCDRHLARHYLLSTTRRPQGLIPESWWITPGQPLLLVEYRPWEVSVLPQYSRPVEVLRDKGFRLAHCWIEQNGRRLGVWFLELHELADHHFLRPLRLHLFRLHTERECLKQILRLIAQGRIPVQVGNEASDRLQRYMKDAVRLVSRESSYGLPRSSILDAAQEATDLIDEGERATLFFELKKIRGNILRNVARFTVPGGERSIVFHIVGGHQIIALGREQNIGGQTMTTYDIKFGDHTVISGNLVVANTIQNSFNKIVGSDVSGELKERLTDLSKSVAEMCNHLPADKAQQAASDLESLTKEATSRSPRRKWYELSAEGLRDAASALGQIAKPVTTCVQAVLNLLSSTAS